MKYWRKCSTCWKKYEKIKFPKTVKFLPKSMWDSILFRRNNNHHEECLRKMFVRYYRPWLNGKINKYWTCHLHEDVIGRLRLHLSWVLRGDVCFYNDEEVGRRIIRRYKHLEQFKFLVNEIKEHEDVMKLYGDTDLL